MRGGRGHELKPCVSLHSLASFSSVSREEVRFYNGGGRELPLLCVWLKLEQQEDKQKRSIGGFRLHCQVAWLCAAVLRVFGLLEGSGSHHLGEGG